MRVTDKLSESVTVKLLICNIIVAIVSSLAYLETGKWGGAFLISLFDSALWSIFLWVPLIALNKIRRHSRILIFLVIPLIVYFLFYYLLIRMIHVGNFVVGGKAIIENGVFTEYGANYAIFSALKSASLSLVYGSSYLISSYLFPTRTQ